MKPSFFSSKPHLNSIVLYSLNCADKQVFNPSSNSGVITSSPLLDFTVVIRKSIVF